MIFWNVNFVDLTVIPCDATRLLHCDTTIRYDLMYSNTPRGTQDKQLLRTDLLRRTLDAVNYKTYGDTTNQLVPREISSESHR